jgi:hypothetical protein
VLALALALVIVSVSLHLFILKRGLAQKIFALFFRWWGRQTCFGKTFIFEK